ncbi:MAG TPA: hypothetical protein VFS44_01055 [Gemmatimonadaceae bacterium]|nr:hypothetical protein [Gemmatimonadaceae bacterium]
MPRPAIWIAPLCAALLSVACRDGVRRQSSRAPEVRVIHLEQETRSGMTARVRWALSPDSSAILLMEDPAGVEMDPVPNAFILAREGWGTVRDDAAWDVAPSPDWRWLAWGRAYLVMPANGDSVSDSAWRSLAGVVGLDASLLERGSFPASGMSMARGFARPVVASIAEGAAPAGTARALDLAGGWRVRWSGDTLAAFGARPVRAVDDAAPVSWTLVDPRTGRDAIEARDSAALSQVAWTEGPLLDIAVPLDLRAPRTIVTSRWRFESRDGVLAVAPAAGGASRAIGPALPLAATRSGTYLAALVPRRNAEEHDRTEELVMLELRGGGGGK